MEKNEFLELVFNEVKGYLKIKDRRLRASKHEFALAKQEFISELNEKAIKWFNKRAKEYVKNLHVLEKTQK